MTNFTSTQVVDSGLALMAKSGLAITLTKAETGCGEYLQDEDVGGLTKLRNAQQEFRIADVKKLGTSVEIKFVISNINLEKEYLFTEIGIYANDPDEGEVLFALCHATPENSEVIWKYNGVFESQLIISVVLAIASGNAITFETAGVFALKEDLESHTDNHENPHEVILEELGCTEDVMEEAFQEVFPSAFAVASPIDDNI